MSHKPSTSGTSLLSPRTILLIRAGSLMLVLGLLLGLPYPSALASPRNPAHSDLICYTAWASIPPVTHHLVQAGYPLNVDISISSRMGGVGVEFWLGYQPFSTSTVINILEGRSAAGAGWQFASFATTYDGATLIFNQAAGNSRGYQWGFTTTYENNKISTLNATNWAPIYSDTLGRIGTSPCEPFDSVSNHFAQFDEGQMNLLAERRRTSDGYAIAIRSAYSRHSLVNQYWLDFQPIHALYLSRSVARQHDLRLYLVGPTWSEGPLRPYQSGLAVQHAQLAYDAGNNPTWLIDGMASYVLLIWQIGSLEAGIAIPLENSANLSLEQTTYCDDPLNDTCGSIRWLTNQPTTHNAVFAIDSVRTYEFAYYVGTPQQLAELGYPLP